MTTDKIILQAVPKGPPEIIYAAQGENNSRRIDIEIIGDNGQIMDLTGATVIFYVVKGKNAVVQTPATVDRTTVHITLMQQATANPGNNPCWLQILRADGYEMRVDNLILRVKACDLDDALVSSNEYSILTKLMDEAKKAAANANSKANLANTAAANATNKAQLADTAATNANNKAQLANTAATNANNAAQACRDATTKAATAAKDANAAAESANNAAQNASLQSGAIFAPVTLSGELVQTNAVEAPFRDFKIHGRGREIPPLITLNLPGKLANPCTVEGIGENNSVQVSVHGKNYMDIGAWISKTVRGLTIKCDLETQIFTLNGTSTGTGTLATAFVHPFFWKSGESYTISVDYLGGSVTLANDQSVLIVLEGGDVNGARLSSPVVANFRLLGKSASMTLTADINAEQRAKTMHVWFWINAAGVKFDNYQFRVQVERGTAATSWEPHRGIYTNIPLPSPLYSLPDGSGDVLEKRDGQWGITKRVGVAVCDGVNLRAGFVGNEADGAFQFNIKPPNTEYRNWRVTYCDKFEFVRNVTAEDGKAFIGSDGSLCFYINKTRTNGQAVASAVNTWLQQNHIFALYPHKETFLPLPADTQTALEKLATIDGENIIYNSGGSQIDVTVEGAVSYLRDRIDGLANKYVPADTTTYQGNELDFVSPFVRPFESFRLHGRTNEILSGAKSPDNPSTLTSVGEDAAVEVTFQGKNLWRRTGVMPVTDKGLTIDYDSTAQVFTINGTSTGTGVLASLCLFNFGWTQGDSYTLSLEHIGGTVRDVNQKSVLLCCHVNDKNSNNTGDLSYTTLDLCNPVPARLTVDAYTAARGARMRVWTNVVAVGAVFDNYQFRVQVERGKTATPWEPSRPRTVFLNLPVMYSLPDGTHDVLEKQNGAWRIQKNVGKFELSNSRRLSQTPIVEGRKTVLITIRVTVSDISADHGGTNIYCDRFPTRPDIFTTDEEGILWTDCLYLRIKHSRFTSMGSDIALPWINTNPTYILYQTNPTYSAVDAAVQTKLNALRPDVGRNLVVNSFGAEMEAALPAPLGVIEDRIDSLTAADVGARPSTWLPTAAQISAVPTSRTVNGKSLSSNITLTAANVGARPDTWLPTATQISAVPTSRTVCGKSLSSNITLTAANVGALSTTSIESGSNERGSWIKFPDGTMIVMQKFVELRIGKMKYEQYGTTYRSGRRSLPDFPQPFVETPYVAVTPFGSYTACMLETAAPTTTEVSSIEFSWPTEELEPSALIAHIIAIGRWK